MRWMVLLSNFFDAYKVTAFCNTVFPEGQTRLISQDPQQKPGEGEGRELKMIEQ